MPPKKGGGKKKKAPVLIDGVDTSSMTRDQLEAFALKLKAEMEREREERNYFQLERDKIRQFWEISRQHLDEVKVELRQKDHEIELAQELSEVDSKQIMQQMKHLQYENSMKIAEVRAEAMTQLKLAQEDHAKQEQQLMRDKADVRRSMRESESVHNQQVQQLKMKQTEDLHELRLQYEREAKDAQLLHEMKMQELRTKLELNWKMQMFEVEERKGTQLQRLMDSHEQAFADMKNYYNDITLNNLGLISSLKDQMEVLRKQAERSDRAAAELSAENRRMKEPVEAAQAELTELRHKLETFDRDRKQLQRLKRRNAFIEKQMEDQEWEAQALMLRNETLTKERQTLKNKFDELLIELQQKASMQNVLLERKIARMEREEEQRRAVMEESNKAMESIMPPEMQQKVSSLMEEKNKQIDQLKYELARACKAHDDLLATYEAKLKDFGIPEQEVGFEPLRLKTKVKYMHGPAGLVTVNK